MSAGTKKALWIGAVGIGVLIVVVFGLLNRRKSGDSPTPPAVETRTETSITLKGRVPISVNVPIPTYRVVMEVPAGAETTSVSRRTEPRAAAPRPAVPTPATPPTPPTPKTDTVRVVVLNGLTSSVEIRYREETSGAVLTGTGGSRTLEPGEEAVLDEVEVGEVLTARVKDAAGKVTGTYHVKVGTYGPTTRIWHVLDYAKLRP